MCYNNQRKLLFVLEKKHKEAIKIKATIMSLFFRSRPPRKLRRTSPHKSRHDIHAPTLDLGAGLFPGPRAVPARVEAAPRRRRAHAGYHAGRPRHAMFRVT
jgi:hypothetical protein